MPHAILRATVVLLTLTTLAGRGSAEFITNNPAWNGTDEVSAFGEPKTATFGQTITVGADHFLDSFSFNLKSQSGAKVDFRAYVYAWDGSKATGSALYTSAADSLAAGTSSFQNFSYNTGGIDLTTGSEYVLLLSASGFFDTFAGTALFGGDLTNDTYTGGGFYFQDSGNNLSLITMTSWSFGSGDLAFTANLSSAASVATPLPPTLLAGFLGVAMLAGVRRFRRA